MSKASEPKRFVHFFSGSKRKIVFTCVGLVVVVFAVLGYMTTKRATSTARDVTARSTKIFDPIIPKGDKLAIRAATKPIHTSDLLSEYTALPKAFPIESSKDRFEEIPFWWKKPPTLTKKEIGYQRYLSSITWQLPKDKWYPFWKIGGNQIGLQSLRYHGAFVGYAAAALGMRTPAYPGLTKRIIGSAIEHLLDRDTWAYISHFWKDKSWYPDPAAGDNIMYTGHLLQLMVLYEALTGDARYRKEGFDFVWDEKTSFHYTLMSLVDVTIAQMRKNPSGGVADEPGHVSFAFNAHPHVALKLLEGLGLGDWSSERKKWEAFALSSFYDELGGGVIKWGYSQNKKKFFPIGYPGMDGWGLMWYQTWASDAAVPNRIWRLAKNQVTVDALKRRHSKLKKGAKSNPTKDLVPYLSAIVQRALPIVPTSAFLYPAAIACGDVHSAKRLRGMIEKRYITQKGGKVFLTFPHKFGMVSNANMILGLALEEGSNMRHLVQRPLPRDYFAGPLIEEVTPDDAVVLQAYRDKEHLIVELASFGPADIVLGNVSAVTNVEGIEREEWRFQNGTLHIKSRGQRVLRIASN